MKAIILIAVFGFSILSTGCTIDSFVFNGEEIVKENQLQQ